MPSTSVEAGTSKVVTLDNRPSRTHEAPSLLIDRNDPDTVYLAAVELQAGLARFYVSPAGRFTRREGPPTRSGCEPVPAGAKGG